MGFTLDSSAIVEIYVNNQIVPKQDAYLDAKAYIELAPDETNPKAITKYLHGHRLHCKGRSTSANIAFVKSG